MTDALTRRAQRDAQADPQDEQAQKRAQATEARVQDTQYWRGQLIEALHRATGAPICDHCERHQTTQPDGTRTKHPHIRLGPGTLWMEPKMAAQQAAQMKNLRAYMSDPANSMMRPASEQVAGLVRINQQVALDKLVAVQPLTPRSPTRQDTESPK